MACVHLLITSVKNTVRKWGGDLMTVQIKINGSVTLDESLGLQNSGIAVSGEDNNDSDVSLLTLQAGAAVFYGRLFNSAADGGPAPATTFPQAGRIAKSSENLLQISATGTVSNVSFTD